MAKNKNPNDLTLENIKDVVRQVVKDEVRGIVKEELKPINFRLGTLEEKVDKMDQKFEKKFDEGMTKVDGLLGIGKNHIEEHAANQTAHDRFEEKFTQVFAHLSP